MKIYVRYVLFGVVKIFTFALFISTFLLLFLLVAETTFGSKVPLSLAFQLIPYLIPEIFSMALPVASLLAVTVFFARMRSNNELIALKSMGIAPWRVLVPVWIFMTGVSVFGIWCNDLSISWTRMQITHVLLEGFETTLLNQLRTEKRFVTPTGQYEIKVSDVTEDGVLLNPEFSGKIGGINGVAESAKIEVDFNVENPVVHIHLTNAEVEATPGQGFLQASYDFPIPLTEVYRSKKRVDPPATKVKEALENLEAKHKAYHRALASNAMFAFLCGNLNGTANEDWKNRAETENISFANNADTNTQYQESPLQDSRAFSLFGLERQLPFSGKSRLHFCLLPPFLSASYSTIHCTQLVYKPPRPELCLRLPPGWAT